jgi:uncharacterized protein
MNKSHFNTNTLEDYFIVSDGLLTCQKFILFIGRSNTAKNSAPLERLLDNLKAEGYTFIWIQHKTEVIASILDKKSNAILGFIVNLLGGKDNRTFRHVSRLTKKLILLMHPLHWSYFLRSNRTQPELSLLEKASQFRKLIQLLGDGKEIIIIAHSAGGRIATSLEDEACVKKIICFGYPFKHPENNEEEERTAHLQHLKKPCLVIQGKRDEYGGEEVVSRYKLSQSIQFEFIDTNHEYEAIGLVQWKSATRAIKIFLG